MFRNLSVGGNPAVDDDFKFGKILFETVDIIVFERRHFAVFFWRQAVQPCVACVDDESPAGRFFIQRTDELGGNAVFRLAVDTDAVFDGNRNINGILHGIEAIGNQSDLVHQTCAECAFLHARTGAAAIKVDFVVAVFFGSLGGFGQIGRFAAAQLQGDGLLAFVKH